MLIGRTSRSYPRRMVAYTDPILHPAPRHARRNSLQLNRPRDAQRGDFLTRAQDNRR